MKLLAILACLGTAAFAQAPDGGTPTPAPAPAADKPRPSALLRPGYLDLRVSPDTDILLFYVSVNAAVDVGLAPIGPGTLAAGASFEFGFCGSFCVGMSALLSGTFGRPTSYGQQFYYPHARLSYHLDLQSLMKSSTTASNRSTIERLDLYALVSGGPMITHLEMSTDDKSQVISGDDIRSAFGAGLGGSYFITDRIFVSAEAIGRYAHGTYVWQVKAGTHALSDTEASWTVTPFSLRFSIGVRL